MTSSSASPPVLDPAADDDRYSDGTDLASRPSRAYLGIALVLAAGVGFGLQNVLAKIAFAGGADAATVLAVRFAVAAAVVLALRRGTRPPRHIDRPPILGARRRLGIVLLGLLFVGSALFAYLALERLPASTTTLVVFTYPALVVVWSRLLFAEPITGRRLLALALALGGCALAVGPSTSAGAGLGLETAGLLLAAASALTNSWYATLAGPIGRGLSGITIAAGSLPITAACFALGLIAVGGPSAAIDRAGWLACLAIGLLAGASITAFLAGLPLIGPSRAAIVSSSEPAASVALGALLLGERLTITALLGGCAVLAAVALLARGPASLRRGADPRRSPAASEPRPPETSRPLLPPPAEPADPATPANS